MPESEPTISVPLYGTKKEIWKIVLAARPKQPAGRKVEVLIFVACHWAMIDFATGANPEKFTQAALVRAVQKIMEARKKRLDCGGAIVTPHINTLNDRCRDWLIWRASKPGDKLKAVRRTNVRQALLNLRYTCAEEIWKARYCENELPESFRKMGVSEHHIKWNNIQVDITKLVRRMPFIPLNKKNPKCST